MTLSKEIKRTTLEEHKKANAGNSGNHYYYKQLSYKALHTVDELEAKIEALESEIDKVRTLCQPHVDAGGGYDEEAVLARGIIERLNSILERLRENL